MARSVDGRRKARLVLERLERALAREYRRQLRQAGRPGIALDQAGALLGALAFLLEAQARLRQAQSREELQVLEALEEQALAEWRSQAREHWAARELLLRLLELLNGAMREALDVQGEPAPARREVVVPSVLLYQAREEIFPPERLLVVAGQREKDGVWLEAAFDVTGASSTGHVRADPTRLARALIAMERTDRFLAAWMHSHPGNSPEATRPSPIDLRQQEDWLRDYSPYLLGATFAGDWIRFWGRALTEEQVTLRIAGAGVAPEEGDGTLWRFA
jgi:proteasome lid subunit RPN8/RPN11